MALFPLALDKLCTQLLTLLTRKSTEQIAPATKAVHYTRVALSTGITLEQQHLINKLLQFLKNEAACQQTLGCLTERAEISIIVAQSVQIRVQNSSQGVQVELAPPLAPDFIFYAQPEAIETLIAERNLTASQLGVKLLKQLISREVQVRMPVNVLQITQHGYLNILKVGGTEFLNELKKHGMSSLPKILNALRSLRH